MPCHAMPCLALPCHAMPCHAMPCHALPCRAVPCRARHAMPCHAMPCHAMPCHAMIWQDMPWHDMPWHDMTWHGISYSVVLYRTVDNYQQQPHAIIDGRKVWWFSCDLCPILNNFYFLKLTKKMSLRVPALPPPCIRENFLVSSTITHKTECISQSGHPLCTALSAERVYGNMTNWSQEETEHRNLTSGAQIIITAVN